MLVDNAYMAYDLDLQEYYLTVDGLTKYTTYTNDEIGDLFDDAKKVLKTISRNVYRLIDNTYIGSDRKSHKKYMRKLIYDNANDEVTSLMYAMLEAVRGALESGMDLNEYTNNPKSSFPKTVWQELRNGYLIDKSQKPNTDLDITYTDLEIVKWS